MKWLLLIVTLPTDTAALRMRLWRTLKAAGAAVLRDGVYVLPDNDACRERLQALAQEVNATTGGSAFHVDIVSNEDERLLPLFDRSGQYRALLEAIDSERNTLKLESVHYADKQAKKLRKALHSLQTIDYFPQPGQSGEVEHRLQDWEQAIRRLLSPDEPTPHAGELSPLDPALFQGRLWATRQRPWVDRLASAWLIRRFIDPTAKLLWLVSPAHCPPDALGFDFDGATFSHVGPHVTFETLVTRFQLTSTELRRLASLVHFLDVGGIEPAEAAGLEKVLAGLRETLHDDDQLLLAASAIFDGLLIVFQKEKETTKNE